MGVRDRGIYWNSDSKKVRDIRVLPKKIKGIIPLLLFRGKQGAMGDISPPAKTAPGGAFEQLFLKKSKKGKENRHCCSQAGPCLKLKTGGTCKDFLFARSRENKVGG